MGEEYRLRPLQVGVAGHDYLLITPRQPQQRPLDSPQPAHGLAGDLAGIKAHIQRNLVVARASGVQSPRRRADELVQPPLDVHVQVFQRGIPREIAGLYFLLDSP